MIDLDLDLMESGYHYSEKDIEKPEDDLVNSASVSFITESATVFEFKLIIAR